MAIFGVNKKYVDQQITNLNEKIAKSTLNDNIYKNTNNTYFEDQVNLAHYTGEPANLYNAYRSNSIKSETKQMFNSISFWSFNNPQESPVVTSGFPRLIATTIGRITFGNGVEVIKKDDDNECSNKFSQMVKEMSVVGAYSGNPVAIFLPDGEFKIFDKTTSFYNKEDDEIVVLSQFVAGKKSKKYELQCAYGMGYIKNTLYHKETWYGKGKRVPLDTIAKTANLQDLTIIDSRVRAAAFIPIESVYQGQHDLFNALDEAYSNLSDLTRKNKVVDYIPECLINTNKNGKQSLPDPRQRRYLTFKGSTEEGSNNQIQVTQPNISIQNDKENIEIFKKQILENIGISSATLGSDAMTSSISTETRKMAESSSLRLREEIIQIYKQHLSDMYMCYDIFNRTQAGELVSDKEYDELEINVNEYITDTPSKQEMIDLYSMGVISVNELRIKYGLEELELVEQEQPDPEEMDEEIEPEEE